MSFSRNFNSPIIVALDYTSTYHMLEFVEKVTPKQCKLKIGKEIFIREGPSLICNLQKRGFDIFLDLKLHDIPNTVFRAVSAAAELGVWMIDIHTSGGEKMMIAAREALIPFRRQAPLLIGVTVLTSINNQDLKKIGIHDDTSNFSMRLANLAKLCGLDGVVCSALEARKIRNICGNFFKLITPGIRTIDSELNDHNQVMTPIQAKMEGSDYLVIGRPIINSPNPHIILKNILQELNEKN